MNESKKEVTIYVDGTEHKWEKGKITYAEVVTLEFPDYPQHPERTYSVTYKKGKGDDKHTLTPGGSVETANGMMFYVTETGQS